MQILHGIYEEYVTILVPRIKYFLSWLKETKKWDLLSKEVIGVFLVSVQVKSDHCRLWPKRNHI